MLAVLPWLAISALTSAGLALADPNASSVEGVWDGKVGSMPIRACFNQSEYGEGFGVYYYNAHLQLIQLRELKDSSGTYVEGFPWDKDAPQWRIGKVSDHELSGEWRNGGKTLPFRLARTPWLRLAEDETPCSSKLFYEPRLRGIRIAVGTAEPPDPRYHRLVLEYPDQKDVGVETIELAGKTPAIRQINAQLRKPFEGNPPEWHECELIAGGGSSSGGWSESWEPKMFGRKWLSVTRYVETYCGGPHPDSWTSSHTYDLQSGREVDLSKWLNKSVGEAAFRRLLLDASGRGDDADCSEVVEQSIEGFALDIELRRNGLAFTPNNLPHVVQACGDEAFISFAELRPYLSTEGKRNVVALQAEFAPPKR